MARALWEVLEGVPDRREASGRRYPLPAILAITVAAMLAGRTSLAAIARWGRRLEPEALRALGIVRSRAPCHSTYHYVFRDLDVDALEVGLAAWVRSAGAAELGELSHVALDGKRLRGSRTAEGPGVHLLAAFCRSLRGVIGQLRVPPDGNEITAALTLLKGLSLEGALVTGDAEFAQREICRTVVDGGGDYFFVVKGNQPRAARGHRASVRGAARGGRRSPPGRPRLTAPHAGTRVTAGSSGASWRPAPPSPAISTGRARRGSVGSSGGGGSGARRAPKWSTRSPASAPTGPPPPTCWPCRARTGRSRTGCTGCATSPCARTSAGRARARRRRSWRPAATPC